MKSNTTAPAPRRRSASALAVRVCLASALLLAAPAARTEEPAAAPPPLSAADARAAAERGVNAYLATRYAEALPDLEKARDGGASTGALLYMLGYCYDTVRRDQDAAGKAYAAAQEALEKEVASDKPSIESYFYLSNLYLNRQKQDESRALAQQGAVALEKGRIKPGKDGISLFRAGKLCADAGRDDLAVAYHRKALEAFAKESAPPPEYLRRSLDTLARAGDTKIDPAVAAATWERIVAANPKLPGGDWNLGIASMRAGRFAQAREAFERVRNQGGDRGQDAFYASSLAASGIELEKAGVKIPEKGASRKPIASLEAQALDAQILEVAKRANELLSRDVKPDEYVVTVTERGRKRVLPGPKLTKEIDLTHAEFVALVTTLLARGESLQTKSFEGGYAPLVIQNWVQLWRTNHRELQEQVAKDAAASPDPS